jgi:hypothetical protein
LIKVLYLKKVSVKPAVPWTYVITVVQPTAHKSQYNYILMLVLSQQGNINSE